MQQKIARRCNRLSITSIIFFVAIKPVVLNIFSCSDGIGKWLDGVFCYSCQGIRGKDKRDDDVRCHRSETISAWSVEMKISSRYCDNYCVVRVVTEHTHVLVATRKHMFLRF